MIIPFTAWTPDQPNYQNQGGITIKNVLPQPGGYAPFGGIVAQTSALAAYPRGAVAVFDTSGNAAVIAGTGTKLYKQVSNSWDDVTNTGGDYSLATADFWEFVQFGNRIIAVALSETPQSFVLGSSTDFADLGGSPPSARTVAAVRDFVVLGHISSNAQQIRWCDINDPTNWSTGQAGSQNMPDGGFVQRLIGGDIGYIFQERGVSQLVYVGGSTIFEVLRVEDARGLLAPGGAIKVGNRIYYISSDGFRMMDVGSGQSLPFGLGRFDDTVMNDINYDYLHRIKTAYDAFNRCVYFSYPSSASGDGTPDKTVAYHPEADKGALIEFGHNLIFPALSVGYTLEELDTISTNIDAGVLLSFDDPAYKGGSAVMGGFDESFQLGYFGGDNLEATLESGEFEAVPNRRSYIERFRPLVDAAAVTGFVRSKERLSDSLTNDTEGTMRTDGTIPTNSEGRYHRVRVKVGAGQTWRFAQGVDIQDDYIAEAGEF